MKRIILSVLTLSVAYFGLTSYSAGPAQGSSLNLTGSQGYTPGCAQSCHNYNANTTVTIEVDSANIPVSSWVPGYTYTIKLQGVNTAMLPKYGFQFAAVKGVGVAQTQAGTFSGFPTNVHSAVVGGITIVEHGTALNGTSGMYNTSFQWTAPAAGAGTLTLYAVLNAVNFNNANNGDQFNYSNIQLTENTSVCPLPIVSTQPLAQTICAESPATLSVTTPTTGVSYQWQKAGVNIPGATASSYTIPSTTIANTAYYKVRLTNTCGTTVSDSVLLTVVPLPVPTITQTGLTLSTQAFTTYKWMKDGLIIPGATAQNYTLTAIGSYRVIVTNNSNCSDTSAPKIVTTLSVGETTNNKTITLYPNPVHSSLNVSTVSQVDAVITNLQGRVIITAKNVSSIDVSSLAPGLYFISLSDKEGNLLLKDKILKQ